MFGRRPSITSLRGIAVAAHPFAAQAGARILHQGGNAFDASVATAAALNVVEPYMSGMAGMGVATCYVAAERRMRALDFISPIPNKYDAGARRRHELARGPHGIGTPASLAGWCTLLDTYGRLSRGEVFAPAIALAREGFPLTEGNAFMIARAVGSCSAFDGWADTFLDADGPPAQGWILRQPNLADTFEAVVADGPAYLHRGPLGDALVAHVASLGACLTKDDLAAVEPVWKQPLHVPYHGLRVHTPPPQSEGFQMLLTLRLLEAIDLPALQPNGPDHLDAVIRAVRLAAEERIRHCNASPDEIATLLSDGPVEILRRRLLAPEPITGRTEYFGDPPLASVPLEAREHTTSFSAADVEGNVVCITQSLGAAFGSGIVVPGYGVVLNDFLNWGELNPDSPNYMAGGAPLSLPIAPSISTRDDRPVLALGTPGSYGITQTQSQALIQHVDFGLDVQAAIEAPRIRILEGARVGIESRIDEDTVAALRRLGHEVERVEPFSMAVGGMQAISLDPATGALQGGADPRRDGYAIGI